MRSHRWKVPVFCAALIAAAAIPVQAQGHGSGPSVRLQRIASGLVAPVHLSEPLDRSGRRFVVDQVGVIRIITREGRLLPRPFLDLRDRIVPLRDDYDERGLLGLAFHPRYAENGRFFVYYSAPLRAGAPAGYDHTSHVSEFRAGAADANRADPGSERLVLAVDQPQSNHNAGQIAFGPDGYLYIPIGDGGGADDQGTRDTVKIGHVEDWYAANGGGNGQDIAQNLLGNILRIDVDGRQPYVIPPDNPFVGTEARGEVWAYGLRNPFGMSFDPVTGRLFAADAGQELWEEVSIIVRGGNYGWNVREGTHCFDAENPRMPPMECPRATPDGTPLRDPIIEFDHYGGVVVVGGSVYRGRAVPEFNGRYLFADWSSDHGQPRGTLFIAEAPPSEGQMWAWRPLAVQGAGQQGGGHHGGGFQEYIRAFGRDAELELYVLTSNRQGPSGTTGKVWKIVGGSMGGGGGHQH